MFAPRSLKVRLSLASAALILASVGLTMYFVLREAGRGTEQIVLESQADDAQRLATAISQRLVDLQRGLRVVAGLVSADAVDDPQQLAEFLRGQPILSTMFSSVFVVSSSGRIVAISDAQGIRNPNTDVSDRPYFRTTVAAGRPVISEVTPSRVSGEPIVVFTMPVVGHEGRVLAVLGAAMRLSSRSLLDGLAQVSADRGSPESTIVTDSHGTILFHPGKGWVMRAAAAEPMIADAYVAWQQRGSPIDPDGFALRVGDHEVGIAGVPNADWLIFRTGRADALLHGIVEAKRRATWLAFGVAAAGGALTLLITFVMLRPLARLRSRSLRLLGDDQSVEGGWPKARGEIGELSQVIQQVMREREASELASQVLLAKMRAVMAKAPVGIAFTRNRRFELLSAEFNRMLGYPDGDLEGETARIIYQSDEFYQGLGARVAEAFGTRRVFSEEIEFVRRDGSRFWGQLLGRAGERRRPAVGNDLDAGRRQRCAQGARRARLGRDARRPDAGAEPAELRDHPGRAAVRAQAARERLRPLHRSRRLQARERQRRPCRRRPAAEGRRVDRQGAHPGRRRRRAPGRRRVRRAAAPLHARIRARRRRGHPRPRRGAYDAMERRDFQVRTSIGVVHIDAAYKDVASVIASADAACYAAKRAGRNAVRSGWFLRLV